MIFFIFSYLLCDYCFKMATGGATDVAIPVIDLPANQSGLLIDSKGRQPNESPYHFQATLSTAVSCDAITYTALNWTQSIYSHTGESAAFMFDLLQTENPLDGTPTNHWYPGYSNGGDYLNTHYVCYHKPYQFYSEFDGNEDATSGGPYKEPQPGSYAYDVETALNTDVRVTNNNLIPINNTTLETLFPDLEFTFRYSKSQGFRLVATYTNFLENTVTCAVRIWPCPSLQIGHRVHGFGVLSNWNPIDINNGQIKNAIQVSDIVSRNNTVKYWLPSWLSTISNTYNVQMLINQGGIDLSSPQMGYSLVNNSDATPTLVPIEYIQVYCPELTFNRKLQSFRNNSAVGENGNNEAAVFPVGLGSATIYKTLVAVTDANVWSIREGYAPQQLTMVVADEDGDDLTASNCWNNYFTQGFWNYSGSVYPHDLFTPFAYESDHYRSSLAMNYLIFAVDNITSTGIFYPTSAWGDFKAVALENTEVVHLFTTINA